MDTDVEGKGMEWGWMVRHSRQLSAGSQARYAGKTSPDSLAECVAGARAHVKDQHRRLELVEAYCARPSEAVRLSGCVDPPEGKGVEVVHVERRWHTTKGCSTTVGVPA